MKIQWNNSYCYLALLVEHILANCHQRVLIQQLTAKTNSKTWGKVQGIPRKKGRQDWRSQRDHKHHKNTVHRINLLVLISAHRDWINNPEPVLIHTKSSTYVIIVHHGVLVEHLTMETGTVSDSLICLWDSFPPPGLSCSALIWGDLPILIETFYARKICPFLKRNGGGGGQWKDWEKRRQGKFHFK